MNIVQVLMWGFSTVGAALVGIVVFMWKGLLTKINLLVSNSNDTNTEIKVMKTQLQAYGDDHNFTKTIVAKNSDEILEMNKLLHVIKGQKSIQ